MATEIAKAYVQIIPTTKGIKNQLENELNVPGAKIGEKAGKSFAGSLAKAILGTAAIKGAIDGVKRIISDYADYEQLVGGVETLFSDSADIIQSYAANAYKTAGMSANQYMETVTSFSASLLQSLGGDTKQAASVADMAITDMADNANKMGTSMESIQNAYQGFAKQNYTMLDNLKLGYGGTKTEMERLLADAEKFSGVKYDISSLNDVYQAIHVVQTEMGITGTTAKEASETISGSLSSMKSAWSNLLVGLADENANFDELVQNFVGTVVNVGENLLPRIEVAVDGAGKLVLAFADTILPMVVETIIEHIPQIIETGMKFITSLIIGLAKEIPTLIAYTPQIVKAIVQALVYAIPEMANAGKQLIAGVWEGIKSMGKWLGDKVRGFFGDIVKSVKNALGIHSPSTVFAKIGGYMAEGVGVGFGGEIGDVRKEISGSLNGLTANVAVSAETVNAGVSSGISGYGTHEYHDVSANQSAMQPIIVQIGNETIANLIVDIMRKEVRLA